MTHALLREVSNLGVLLVNLGTPAAPTTHAVRQFLRDFLLDPRVVEIPRPIWWIILYGIILPFRSPRSARAYQEIWQQTGSPLLSLTTTLGEILEQELQKQFSKPLKVVVAMRYGEPSIEAGLKLLREQDVRSICILPLYPQYSATTTASALDAVMAVLKKWRWLPSISMLNHYADHPAYIQAISDSIRQKFPNKLPYLLFSFHGLPKTSVAKGDPYYYHCHQTTQLIIENLQLPASTWELTFQSRLGRAEWLQPYTQETLINLPKRGITEVVVICPGFAVDCLETLEEINLQNREAFLNAGGKVFHYIPALNTDAAHVELLSQLAFRQLQALNY